MTEIDWREVHKMSYEDAEKYLDEIYKKDIAELRSQGKTDEELLKDMNVDRAALKAAGVKPSYLIPKSEMQYLNDEDWDSHIGDGKWEFCNGIPFAYDGYCRDSIVMALITNMGLKHLVELLPDESIDELRKIINK